MLLLSDSNTSPFPSPRLCWSRAILFRGLLRPLPEEYDEWWHHIHA
nr:MAG TPA: hypothetical protein [Caudoviricetes sp.]